jgi:hypothetical protein
LQLLVPLLPKVYPIERLLNTPPKWDSVPEVGEGGLFERGTFVGQDHNNLTICPRFNPTCSVFVLRPPYPRFNIVYAWERSDPGKLHLGEEIRN